MERLNKDVEGKPVVVIPTIRSKEYFQEFLEAWKEEFKGVHVIVVEDRKKKILDSVMKQYVDSYTLYDWRDIDKDLGDKAWIIPRKTDCVRSYGYYKAWQMKPNMIVTLDDDVRPQEKHLETFYKKLYLTAYPEREFYNTLRNGLLPRGTYSDEYGCDVVHGGWMVVPDLSAEGQIENPFVATKEDFNKGIIPQGAYFSLCGMNIAWRPEHTKHLYFGLQGLDKYPIDRCGDIWAGYNLTQQKLMVYTGEPFVYHNRASNVWSNLKKESHAWELSSLFIDWNKKDRDIDQVSMLWIADDPEGTKEYFDKLKLAYSIWEGLFNE